MSKMKKATLGLLLGLVLATAIFSAVPANATCIPCDDGQLCCDDAILLGGTWYCLYAMVCNHDGSGVCKYRACW